MSRYIIVPDSFKGCLSSSRVADAIEEGIKKVCPEAQTVKMPVSDGGEGMLSVIVPVTGAERVKCTSFDPLMRRIEAEYAVSGDTACIESALTCGMSLLTTEELNPMVATTYGLGLLVVDALNRGCRHIIVGLGGTATCDAGVGMLRAINDKFSKNGHFDDNVRRHLEGVSFTILSDVLNPLLGNEGAARVFAPQKGASPEDVDHLEWRIGKFAAMSARHFGRDCSTKPSAGAAGGLGYAFMQYLDADVRSGADYILSLYNYSELVNGADAVFTGEGCADAQTLMGKLPFVVMKNSAGVPVHLVCGKVSDRAHLIEAGFNSVTAVSNPDKSDSDEMNPDVAYSNIVESIKSILK